jgi:hypothetical protein
MHPIHKLTSIQTLFLQEMLLLLVKSDNIRTLCIYDVYFVQMWY